MLAFFCIPLAYLLGSVPFGLLVAKNLCHLDPRTAGSRNIGATNVARLCGFKYGVLTYLLDGLKGFVPVWLAIQAGGGGFNLTLVALAAVLGHMYSCFLGFNGGKGVATTIGVFLALAPLTQLLLLVGMAGLIAAHGTISLASLFYGAALPVFLLLGGNGRFVILAVILAVLLFWKHKDNILRLARGEEQAWIKKKA